MVRKISLAAERLCVCQREAAAGVQEEPRSPRRQGGGLWRAEGRSLTVQGLRRQA